ncbi:MAG: efflux RND transporter periplasmic adaptor subunit, partial [Novosphingobium sp.]|nr:efflux RND transporter periplasmic adaptor subunit [Novosphingobium sp.]
RSANSRPTPVILEPVVFEAERTRIEAVGTARAIRSVTLHAAVAGEVTAVHFKANQAVSPGKVLVELDRRDAELARALAKVQVEDAKRLLNRYERTAGHGAFTLNTIDSARTTLEAARIEEQRAVVALEDRSIKAPFAGFVGITEIEPGNRIEPDTAITTLDDRSKLLVSFEIPELFFEQLTVGDPVSIASWTTRDMPIEGRIVDIGARIDPVSRTFLARAQIPNPNDRLRPGMSFRVSLVLAGPVYPVVPEVAVQWGGDGAYIWAVHDAKARRVGVAIVQRRAGRVLVDAKLEDGISIVVEGVQRMREGQLVTPLDPQAEDDAFLARRRTP